VTLAEATPAPWRLEGEHPTALRARDVPLFLKAGPGHGHLLGVAFVSPWSPEVAAANARLMVQAPALLERVRHRIARCPCAGWPVDPAGRRPPCDDCLADMQVLRDVEGIP